MKAKEFKKFVALSKYKMSIQLEDLDKEIHCSDFGSGCYFPDGGGSLLSEKELVRFWNKEVVNFEIKQNECNIVYATYPPTYPAPTYTLVLYISSLTEEQRKEADHKREVEAARKELERLSGHQVKIGAKIKEKKLNDKVRGKPLTITGTIIGGDDTTIAWNDNGKLTLAGNQMVSAPKVYGVSKSGKQVYKKVK